MQIVMKNVEVLIPYENNPRRNDQAVEMVTRSIKEYGFRVPIVIDKDNVIVTGHTRLKAALNLGMRDIPCVVADDLTSDKIRAFRLADNKTAEVAEWDFEKLQEELSELSEKFAQDFGFNLEDLPEELDDEISNPYTQKLDIPQYAIKGEMPSFIEMVDAGKAEELLEEIESADITDQERTFLKLAASRHNVFNYGKIAEYYAHAGETMQDLMEKSALVIIDFDDAIRRGYVKLSSNIEQLYNEEYVDE